MTAICLAACAAGLLAGCDAGKPDRPPLALPAADRFQAGACRDAADAVLTLGRFAYDHDGAKRLSDADRAELAAQSDRLVPVRDGATEPLSGQLRDLLAAVGFMRIRTGPTYDPQLLRDMESARMTVQSACTA
jgi:hypothetical protein